MSLESDPAEPADPAKQADSARRGRLLDDPYVIRALAHPLRLDLFAALGRRGQATTSELARDLDIIHGVASHHLRQLAKYGFVEQVPGKDRREHPWRQLETGYQWPDSHAAPETTAGAAVLQQIVAERVLEGFLRWQQQRGDWPEEWLEGSGVSTMTVYLTAAELAELGAELDAVLRRYIDARPIADTASRPAGSVPVDLAYFAVPTSAPSSPSPSS